MDTSALYKKYVEEPGSDTFEKVLMRAGEIAVSPVTWIEMNAALGRCVRNRSLPSAQADRLRVEIKKDFVYFSRVLWNDNLEEKAAEIVRKHTLRTLDSIQLASAILSESDLFVTSDRKLYTEARTILKHVQWIG